MDHTRGGLKQQESILSPLGKAEVQSHGKAEAKAESAPCLSPSFRQLLGIRGVPRLVDTSPQLLPLSSHGLLPGTQIPFSFLL